jgi:hypothetical protein
MKLIVLVVLLNGGLMVSAQAPMPSLPNGGTPNAGKLFQFSPGSGAEKPHFKLQIPEAEWWSLPEFNTVPSPAPGLKSGGDPGMVHRPHGFVEQPSRPALPSKIYPGLKVLPIELAGFEAPAVLQPGAIGEPIPITWPNARVEPIPLTWEAFRMRPVSANSVLPAEKK